MCLLLLVTSVMTVCDRLIVIYSTMRLPPGMSTVHLGTGGSSVFSTGAGGALSEAGGCSEGRGSSSGLSSASRGLESRGGTCDVDAGMDVVVVVAVMEAVVVAADVSCCESAKVGLVESELKGGKVLSCETGGRPGAADEGWS